MKKITSFVKERMLLVLGALFVLFFAGCTQEDWEKLYKYPFDEELGLYKLSFITAKENKFIDENGVQYRNNR